MRCVKFNQLRFDINMYIILEFLFVKVALKLDQNPMLYGK